MNNIDDRTTRPNLRGILVAVMLLPTSAFGEIIVRQIDAATSTVTAEITADEKVQEKLQLFLNLDNDSQCVANVLQVEGKHIVLDTTKCKPSEIRKGATLEIPLVEKAEGAPALASESLSQDERKEYETVSQGWRPSLLDISYIPQANQLIGVFGINISKSTGSIFHAGQNISLSNSEKYLLTTGLLYGITNDLTMSVKMDTALSSSENVTYGPASTSNGKKATYESTGPSDPSIGLNFRLVSQSNQQPFTAFVGVELRPTLVDAKSATETTEGTRGSGGSQVGISLSFARENSRFGVGGKVGYLFRDNRSSKDATTDEVDVTSGGHQFSVGVQGLFKVSPFFAVSANINCYSVSAEENESKNGKLEVQGYSFISPNIGIRSQIIPERLLLIGTYSAVRGISTRVKRGSLELDASTSSDLYSAAIVYLF